MSEESFNDINYLELNCPRRSYLVTYSHLDHRIFPRRCTFGKAIVESFAANNVHYFVATKEPHDTPGKYHYHVAILLTKPMRWFKSKAYLKDNYNIVVNFGTSSGMYSGAYRYATKMDNQPFIGNVLSKHPNLHMVSHTYTRALEANSAYRINVQNKRLAAAESSGSSSSKKVRIKKGDVAMFVVENDIRDELGLINLSTQRKNLGDRALYDFLMSLRRQQREELVHDAWRFENAEKIIADTKVDIVEALHDHATKVCVCDGVWLSCAKDILAKNGIVHSKFAEAVFTSLEKGRQKHVNLILIGPGNCGKTFLLKPITKLIPNVFMNPASSTFGWMGVENSNLIFLNDLRWKPRGMQGGNIDWGDFLNLLEGMEVSLPAPMNTHSAHILVKKAMPILATSIAPVTYWVRDVYEPQTDRHKEENFMMSERWNIFKLTYQIPQMEKVSPPECTACFSKFVLHH